MSGIRIKSPREIETMRRAGEVTAAVMEELAGLVRPGVSTGDFDRAASELIRARGARPAFLGYRGYPAAICVSVNEEVVHGIPGARVLRSGDIVSLDVGVEVEGYYGDMARTFPVGAVNGDRLRLVEAARRAMEDGIAMAREGERVHDISHAIERRAAESGFTVVRDYVGHGIGSELHEDPQIPNYGTPRTGKPLRVGMTLAVEAMVNMGTHAVKTLADGWTVVTGDGKSSAHFEDTIVVTAE